MGEKPLDHVLNKLENHVVAELHTLAERSQPTWRSEGTGKKKIDFTFLPRKFSLQKVDMKSYIPQTKKETLKFQNQLPKNGSFLVEKNESEKVS